MSRARRVASEATLDMGDLSGWWKGMNNQEVIMLNPVQQPDLIRPSNPSRMTTLPVRRWGATGCPEGWS